jgi:hypothetical protein
MTFWEQLSSELAVPSTRIAIVRIMFTCRECNSLT